jgi:anti-anti-sigma factor
MKVETDDSGRRILTLAGDVDLQTAGLLREQLVAEAGSTRVVVIDLRDVVFMDSPGLGALIHCWRVLAHSGTDLIARAPQGDVLDLLVTTGTDDVITIEDDAGRG